MGSGPQTEKNDADRVHIFDTTLRDGEQSPGISLNTAEKVEIAQQLARLGVDVIEAGFPITSPGDFEAVQEISRRVEGPVICGLARTHKADIDAAWGAVKEAARPRIHTFISTSDIHIEHQLQTDREDVKGQARAAVALAKSYCEDVEFSPMDATRADIEFTAEVCAIAVEEGATTVNIPDTVGYTTPEEYADYFRRLYELVPALSAVELSVHCHDDLGLAVANSYAGVLAGARQVECAVNGIGERAGNCSLEEIAMLVGVREDVHGLWTGINTREIARTSRMVSRLTGYPVQPNKAVVGRNAFAHESGIHQDGVLKERSTYEIMDATEVGLESNSIVLGKHSGRHALKDALEQLGFKVEGQALNNAFKAFKEVADRKKQVTALDLEAIVSDEMRERSDAHELAWFEVEAGSRKPPLAKIAVTRPSGEESVGEASGDGPVDAIFHAIQDAVQTKCELVEYKVEAVTGGEDALGEVTVQLRAAGRLATGQGVATDILEASARAYVRALSNALEGAATREAEAATAEAAVERTPGP
ncbi:MAG TPA: 2-isopropylmalate synthase [Solirubrobacterales bacterium]|nr:2-isopropylmalate synthase [Solirubrobacterales bacterium]